MDWQISRRRFLKSLGAALGAGSGSLLAAPTTASVEVLKPPVSRPGKIVVGGHVWVYAAPQPGYDPTPALEQAFADISYAGIDAIELMDSALRHSDAVERIGDLVQKYRLPVLGSSYGGPMWDRTQQSAILEDAEAVVSRLAKLGGRTFGTSVGRAPQKKTPEQLDAQAEMVKKITALCKANGIVLNLHNHTYEVEDNEYDLKGTLARVPDAKLGPDLNWLVRAGEDPADFIRRYASRIIFMHLRDQKADGTWSEALGEGTTDFNAIGRELKKIHYAGDAVIELAHEKGFQLTRPLRETWKMSRQYVRKTLGF